LRFLRGHKDYVAEIRKLSDFLKVEIAYLNNGGKDGYDSAIYSYDIRQGHKAHNSRSALLGITGDTIGAKANNNDFDAIFTNEVLKALYQQLEHINPNQLELEAAFQAIQDDFDWSVGEQIKFSSISPRRILSTARKIHFNTHSSIG
jgi:hypothetical protein